jgi:hypothetical protein
MPKKVSEPFRLRVVAQSPDNGVWLGGNGNWGDGANRSNPTYRALQSVVDSINPTTGGWAQLPGTTLNPVLLTVGEAAAIHRGIWQNEGSKACVTTWASAFWDGKSFMVGCCGGHGAYNGNELYRVRVTDPPAAVRMYNPAPLPGVPGSAGDQAPIWGPAALHHYDSMLWSPELNKGIYRGTGHRFHHCWLFDPTAPTPKSAWTIVSSGVGEPAKDPYQPVYASFCMMTATRMYYWNNLANIGSFVLDLATGERRKLNPYPSDPFKYGIGSIASYSYLRRASISLTSKVWFTSFSGVTGTNRYHVMSYDPQAGTFSSPSAGNAFPTWWPIGGTQYRTIALATGSFGERIVGYPGNTTWAGNPGNEQYKVFCYDPGTHTMSDYTLSADPKPTGSVNGTPAQRWQFVPQVKAFVALLKHTENVWVFRPPAAWGII